MLNKNIVVQNRNPKRTRHDAKNPLFNKQSINIAYWNPGGGTSIWGVHGGVPRVRVIFSRKSSEKGMSIFHKNSGKGYNICKKFQIGSVILMTQMTNQKKTELIDFFDLVGLKIYNF